MEVVLADGALRILLVPGLEAQPRGEAPPARDPLAVHAGARRPLLGERAPELEDHPRCGPRGAVLRPRGRHHELLVAHHAAAAVEAHALHRRAPERRPVGRREVDRLRAVEPMVESAVVRPGERHDEVVLLLHTLVDGAAMLAEQPRGEHGDELQQQIRVHGELLRHDRAEGLLEKVGRVGRHAVPGLGLPPVVVVHAVEEVVLHMPAEARERHPDVHPGHDHARDAVLEGAQHRLVLPREAREVVKVPRGLAVEAVVAGKP
mmetsp:Transcript_54077/g.171585  ORF Transcript_54077/g.171585 Transcript_54077/m.171585 type:complete len:262 (+) Transcript_54077:713-1498(+)